MFLTVELQTTRVYISIHLHGLFKPSHPRIRARKIALRDENVVFWCANAPQRGQFRLSHDQLVLVVSCSV